jgi:biotin-dependent carboxylase-like uncharacterized protein
VNEATVLDPGPLTTVQDRGRAGWAHLGVPRAGALDRPAAELANRLVGNRWGGQDEHAVLETTLGGVTLRFARPAVVAVTGAEATVRVDDRAVAFAGTVQVPAGATLRVGAAVRGVRSYVAVAGGIATPEVLGSRSVDTLAHVGGHPLHKGDVVPLGEPTGTAASSDLGSVRGFARPAVLRLVPGPRDDWFDDAALRTLTSATYQVTGESNRVGMRLDGPTLRRAREGELPSEGIVLGAVQVPASGLPLVFLHDHPTTGGYPVIGVVDTDDLWQCAQLRPGEQVRFRRR